MKNFNECPRCGERAYERMKTYSHCSQCLYFEDRWSDSEMQFYKAVRDLKVVDPVLNANVISLENVIKLPRRKAAEPQKEAEVIPFVVGA